MFFSEWHNRTLLDMALPMLADYGGGERLCLLHLDQRSVGHAILYANDLRNATPAFGAVSGSAPPKAFLARKVMLGVFQRLSCVDPYTRPSSCASSRICTAGLAGQIPGV
jgi:hypothetical protein